MEDRRSQRICYRDAMYRMGILHMAVRLMCFASGQNLIYSQHTGMTQIVYKKGGECKVFCPLGALNNINPAYHTSTGESYNAGESTLNFTIGIRILSVSIPLIIV